MMNQTSGTPTIRPRWSMRYKRLLMVGGGLLLLIVMIGLAGLYYIRSGRLNRYIADQVVTALKEYGLRAEIGGFDIAWGLRTAKLRDIKVYNQETGQLIATIDRVELVVQILDPFALRLTREVEFKRLDLSNLKIWLEVDKEGRSNLRGIHAAPQAPSRIKFDTSSLKGVLAGGTIHVNDQAHQIEGDLGNLQASAQPIPENSEVKVQLGTGAGRIRYQGRETNIDGIDLAGRIGVAGAEIERLALRSPLAAASVSGRVDDWNAIRYNLKLQSKVALAELAKVLDPQTKMWGAAVFDGRVEGEGAHYRISGELTSDDLAAAGAEVKGAKIEGISIQSNADKISFESKNVRANTISVEGARMTNVTAGLLRGEFDHGRTHADLPQVTVARIDLPQGQISETKLENINATIDNGNYRVRGSLGVKSGTMRGASVGPINGELVADNKTVALNQFKASLFGGSATGDVAVQLGRGGKSQLKADFTGLKTNDIFKLASVNNAPLTGTADGKADLSWPGTDVMAATGTVTAHLKGETVQTADAIPMTGDIAIRARGGVFDINQLTLNTDASHLTATGQLSSEGNSDLRFSLTSSSAEQLQTIALSVDEVRKAVAEYEPQIMGDFKFEGRVTGSLKNPAIEGDLNLGSIGLYDEQLGSLSGHVLFSPTEARFENAVLTATNGGTAKFTYAAPREAIATEGHLDAVFDRISITTLAALGGLPSEQKFIGGDLSGEAHLKGLPGSPQGTVSVNLINGIVAGQTAQTATANVVFDGQTARIERAEVRLPQGHLTAGGTFDLKSYNFQLQGRADSVNLSELASAFELTNPRVAGTADANLQVSGNAKDLEQLKVELTAQGQNVTINGRAAGELRLTGRTSANGRIDVDLVTGISGKPQPLRASIELRKPGRPIEIETDLTDFDLGPIITAFAPDLASSLAGTVNGKLRVAGPIVNEQGEMTFDNLRGNLSLTTVALQVQGSPINIETPLVVSLNGPQLTLERTRITGEGIDLALGGTLGLSEGAKLNFTAKGTIGLEPLSRLNPDLFFEGKLTVDARIEGTTSGPVLAGEVQMNGLAFSSLDPPLNIEDGYGRVVLSGEKITLEYFNARANDGTIDLNGTMTLDQFRPKEWRFGLTASDLLVFYQGAQATLEGDLTLTGTPQEQLLSGTVYIPQADYSTSFNFDSLTSTGTGGGFDFGGGGGGGKILGLAPVRLNVHVEADDSLLIRNEQVNTVGSARMTIGGTLNDPDITGRISLEGGTIKFRSQRYDITTGIIEFPVGAGMTPFVNIMTEADVSGYHVYVGLNGPANDMDVTLRSEPDLPRSDVLSLVTTGRTESDTLGSDELVRSGVGTAASLLSEQLISKPTESLLGLSRFQIDPVLRPNANPAARLTIGRQIARDLSFTYSTNLGSEQDQTALAEYTLTNRFSTIASYTQGGSSARGGSTDSDFTIEVRGRKRFSLGYIPTDLFAGTRPNDNSAGTPRHERKPLPRAAVSLADTDGVKLNQKKMRELLPVAKEGYSRPLARLGERNLTNYLQEKGYFFATVTSRCEPANCSGPDLRVLYDVEPGQRLDLEELRLEGTKSLSIGDVKDEFQSEEASFLGGIPFLKTLPLIGGYARGITSNDRLRHDREVIRRRLVDLGFRSARVETKLAFKPDSDNLVVVFNAEEGPQSVISEVAIKGNTIVPNSELRKAVPIKADHVFSQTLIRNGTQSIKKFYADRGYLDATTELEIVDLPENRVRLIYHVEEGNRNIATEILIAGQTKTREESIRRFLAFNPGDPLTPNLIRRTQRDLYATGAFREVNIRTEPMNNGDEEARRVTVGVTESRPLLFLYGLGYSTDDGPRGLIQFTNTNLFGRVDTASIRMRVSRREQLGQIQYTDLRPFGTKWATTISAFYDRNTDLQTFVRRKLVNGKVQSDTSGKSFGINRLVGFIQTERKLSEMTSLRFRYSFENARLSNTSNIPLEEIARNQRSIRLGLFSAGISHDTRDSAINPTKGQLLSAEHSIAAHIFGGNESYNKFFGNYQRYKTLPESTPLLHDTVLAMSARIGLAAPFNKPRTTTNGDDNLLPISERFFAGGATTLRGFRFEEAGPQGVLEPRTADELPTLVPLGGDALAIFNFELRYPLTRRLRLVPFYDLGNVFRKVHDINFSGMTNTVGLGIRFNTPIGPVGVDYGYLLDPPFFVTATGAVLRQPRGVIHIRFGQTF